LPAALNGCPNACRGSSRRECVTRLGRAAERGRQRLTGLAGPQERAGQDGVRLDPVGRELLAERPSLLASLGAEAA